MQVLSVDAKNTEALFTLGLVYSDSVLSQPHKAIELFTQVLELQPDHQEAMLSLARVYVGERRCKEAAKILDNLVQQEPTHAEAAKKCLDRC